MRLLALVLGLAASGCVTPSLVTCEDGWQCPSGTRCATDPQPGDARCVSTSCGDGTIGAAEGCDGSDLAGQACTDRGFYGGELACNPATCQFDTSRCEGRCGDLVVNGTEQCDGAELVTIGCTMLGTRFDIGRPSCTDQCTFDTAPCGYLGFDPIYDGSGAISRFCAYESAPGAVVHHVIQAGTVMRVEDGADTKLPGLNGADDFTPGNIACVPSELAVTQDGLHRFDGTAWRVVPLAPAHTPTRVEDLTEFGDSLVSVGYGGLIVTSSGTGWTVEHYDEFTEALQAVWIDPSTQQGYAASADGVLMHRDVAGGVATWTTVPLGAPMDTRAIWGASIEHVLAVTGTLVARLVDDAWITQPVPPGPIHGTAHDEIFIASGDGRLSHFDGRLWSRSVDPVGAFVDVWVGSDGSVTGAIGAELVRATSLWLALTTAANFVKVVPRPGDLPDVWTIAMFGSQVLRNGIAFPAPVNLTPRALAVADGIAFVAGNSGVGRLEPGVGWQTQAITTMAAVAARDGSRAIAVGGSSVGGARSATYDNGTWTLHPIDLPVALTGIATVPGGRVVAIGDRGTLLESVDGATWTVIDPGFPVTADLHGIWTAPDGTAIVVGDQGTVLRRDPLGAWTAQASGTVSRLLAVGGTSLTDMFAAGENVALRFDGVAWTPVRSPVAGTTFTSVAATPERVYLTSRTSTVQNSTFVLYRAR